LPLKADMGILTLASASSIRRISEEGR
jgi:hypothetical protein